jgi:predicted aspartyl protease
MVWLWEIRI